MTVFARSRSFLAAGTAGWLSATAFLTSTISTVRTSPPLKLLVSVFEEEHLVPPPNVGRSRLL